LCNEGVHDLYISPNISQVIKSRRMRMACMGDRRGAYRVLVVKSEVKRPHGRPRCRWEDNIKMDNQETGWGVWIGLISIRIGTGGRLLLTLRPYKVWGI
jgi:hypothetical protein